ncbi:MAG TPA: hypothetical protein ENN34_12060 [Deltaproteobacteria bacterium]|nr:hypothetical protein [Deltaproteobacteria bacterium]
MSLREEVLTRVKALLKDRRVDGVLGLSLFEKEPVPCLFEDPFDVDALVIEPKWLLAKLAMNILKTAPQEYRLGLVCRGCDDRAVTELAKRNQLDRNRLTLLGIPCTAEQARKCLCSTPYPREIVAGERVEGMYPMNDEQAQLFLTGSMEERMKRWARELNRCIKCYGCRNVCPICVCIPCKLEDDLWVKRGHIPADMVSYHLIRAFHLSDTCVSCAGCTDTCPVNIPLMLLQVSMRETLKSQYAYEPGLDPERVSPVLTEQEKGEGTLFQEPAWIDSLRGGS